MSEEMNLPTLAPSQAMVDVESHRAIQEVQAAMVIAKKFPRDQKLALDRIMQACTRPGLAEAALYSYNRGGTDITGPSIRLAEAMAQQWGNIKTSVRELEQRNGESTVQAIAWDLETGYQAEKVFQVPHVRYRRPDKGGSVKLEDPRDIYEHVANQGARRLRACILAVMPGDVVEAATRQCEVTLKTKVVITPELLQETLDRFAEFGVTKEMIEKRIQRRFDAITPALVVNLKKIFNSLRDGMSGIADWFDVPKPEGGNGNAQTKDKGVDAFMNKTGGTAGTGLNTTEIHDGPKVAGSDQKPTIKEVSALIKKGDFDGAADLARSFPEPDRGILEKQISEAVAKASQK